MRQKLLKYGVKEKRVTKVISFAATDPLVKEDPYDPVNRRVSIELKDPNAAKIRAFQASKKKELERQKKEVEEAVNPMKRKLSWPTGPSRWKDKGGLIQKKQSSDGGGH